MAIYHEALPELARVTVLDSKGRKKGLAEFWRWVLASKRADGSRRATTSDEAISWIRSFFERARANDFVMGRIGRAGEHANWRCNLDYLVADRGRLQVIEKTEVAA